MLKFASTLSLAFLLFLLLPTAYLDFLSKINFVDLSKQLLWEHAETVYYLFILIPQNFYF